MKLATLPSSTGENPTVGRPLLDTKLHVPNCTPTLVSRPRLMDRLISVSNGRITLISAPAGFGKTTLVTDWVQRQNQPVAWITLDEHDNDPVLFWRYLIAAIQKVDNRVGKQVQNALGAYSGVEIETAVIMLINDISQVISNETRLTVVLDDFHWIQSAAVHQSLNYLLQNQPSQLQLIIVTRADPPLSLARLRVEGRLEELRLAELRMNPAEIDRFLNQVSGLNLSKDDLDLLKLQTEGWPAGLQLAALFLRRQENPEQLVKTLSGIKQHVFSYLMEEVLQYQSEEVRQFLQQTAVLNRFCAPLCSAVTGQSHSAMLLQQLSADNFFINPINHEGQWFRYHPLFAEMLKANLDETVQSECHRRAAKWYFDQKLIQDAMQHALLAKDYELMASILMQSYKQFLAQGLLVSLQKWLSALPLQHQTPRLRFARAWCHVYDSGEPELEQLIAEISQMKTEDDPSFQGEILAVRAIYASLYGDFESSIQWAGESLKLLDTNDHLSQAAAFQALGNAYRNQGNLDEALVAYGQARRYFEELGNVFMIQLPILRYASIQIMQGHLHQALQTYDELRQRAQSAGYEPLIMAGEIFGLLSELYLEWQDLDQALAYARQEINLAQSGHMLLGLVDGYLKLAAVESALGDEEKARQSLSLAGENAELLQSDLVSDQISVQQARYDLTWGNLSKAGRWAEEYFGHRDDGQIALPPLHAQVADLLLARIWLAQGQTEKALAFIREILSNLHSGGRLRLTTEAMVLESLALSTLKEEKSAQKSLMRAIELAEPEGYKRVFIENGPDLIPLLQRVRHHHPQYVEQLLKCLPTHSKSESQDSLLMNALTEREQEILDLIGLGYSNRQIAGELFISVGTVKGHINHIFSKLDVKNRTQALLRARELDLI